MLDNKTRLESYSKTIDKLLSDYVPDDGTELSKSMRYTLLAGGKRIRPIIALAFCKMCKKSEDRAYPFACALEMVHTYSLIFDDLPAMDNDDMRRGQPSNHKVYGEAVSMLAGMGLLSKAFEIVSEAPKTTHVTKDNALKAALVLAKASGYDGITLGQALDIKNDGKTELSSSDVERIHSYKTSAMLEASAIMGCLAAGANDKTISYAREYAVNLGLAFQIRDDILDVIGSPDKIGKSVGKDKNENKTTFVDIYGIEKAQEEVKKYTEKAKSALMNFDNNEFLMWLTDLLCEREK